MFQQLQTQQQQFCVKEQQYFILQLRDQVKLSTQLLAQSNESEIPTKIGPETEPEAFLEMYQGT